MTQSPKTGRRDFLLAASAVAAGALHQGQQAVAAADPAPACPGPAKRLGDALDLSAIPNFCSHEHWGSIDSIGMVGEGFRADVEQGAIPRRRTGLFDILVDPYFGWLLQEGGINTDALAKQAGAKGFRDLAARSATEAMKLFRPVLRPRQMLGVFQCMRRGLLALHGIDPLVEDDAAIAQLDASVARRYEKMFEWYPEAMRKANLSELIRPVHPEFFVRKQTAETAAAEARFTHTILRIDPLLQLWRKDSGRRDALAKLVGVEPADAKSWRRFLGGLFDLAAKHKTTGIKQLQAYHRPLDFRPVADSEVVCRGDLTPAEVRVFEDWMVHECCKQAHDRGWPHQVHVGTHNLPHSSPLPMIELAGRYPRMKIVQLHCWPFLKEAGWLAAHCQNVYIETCALTLFGANTFREAMGPWLGYVPTSKIMCCHDGTSVEMAVGSALFTRELLAEILQAQARPCGLGKKDLVRVAADMLQNNAVAVYGIGKAV